MVQNMPLGSLLFQKQINLICILNYHFGFENNLSDLVTYDLIALPTNLPLVTFYDAWDGTQRGIMLVDF